MEEVVQAMRPELSRDLKAAIAVVRQLRRSRQEHEDTLVHLIGLLDSRDMDEESTMQQLREIRAFQKHYVARLNPGLWRCATAYGRRERYRGVAEAAAVAVRVMARAQRLLHVPGDALEAQRSVLALSLAPFRNTLRVAELPGMAKTVLPGHSGTAFACDPAWERHLKVVLLQALLGPWMPRLPSSEGALLTIAVAVALVSVEGVKLADMAEDGHPEAMQLSRSVAAFGAVVRTLALPATRKRRSGEYTEPPVDGDLLFQVDSSVDEVPEWLVDLGASGAALRAWADAYEPDAAGWPMLAAAETSAKADPGLWTPWYQLTPAQGLAAPCPAELLGRSSGGASLPLFARLALRCALRPVLLDDLGPWPGLVLDPCLGSELSALQLVDVPRLEAALAANLTPNMRPSQPQVLFLMHTCAAPPVGAVVGCLDRLGQRWGTIDAAGADCPIAFCIADSASALRETVAAFERSARARFPAAAIVLLVPRQVARQDVGILAAFGEEFSVSFLCFDPAPALTGGGESCVRAQELDALLSVALEGVRNMCT
jgi:hypothetical protein